MWRRVTTDDQSPGRGIPDRCTPEYERVLAKMGALASYGRAVALMAQFLPLGGNPGIETARRRTLKVGARLERELLKAKPPATPAAKSIAVSVDGGHVKSIRSYQVRSFQVLLAEASNDRGQHQLFSSVAVEADRERLQLGGVLGGLGATPETPITVLTDGAEGPRSLGEAASPGLTRHVLDWFHFAIRVQHVAQTVRGWPCATDKDRQNGALFAETIERIRWRLWHGQVRRALDLIGETLEKLGRNRLRLTEAYADRLKRTLQVWKATCPASRARSSTMRRLGDLRNRSRQRRRRAPSNASCTGA